jgi:hypothetical protein
LGTYKHCISIQPKNRGARIRDGPAFTITTTNKFPLTEGCMNMNTTITRRTALAGAIAAPVALPVAS